jgi:hypothetical protein
MGSDPRPISSSRAFWELKAEQVMDRVFSTGLPGLGIHPGERPTLEGYIRDPYQPEPTLGISPSSDPAPIDVVVHDEPPRLRAGRTANRALHHRRTSAPAAPAAGRSPLPRPLLALLAALSVVGVGSTLVVWRGWTQASLALKQERTLQLLERLRSLGPVGQAEPGATAAATAQPIGEALDGSADGLPPPPPEEAWVQELAPLEGASRASSAEPLRVPVSGTIARGAPPAPVIPEPGFSVGSGPSSGGGQPAGAEGGPPELVGVVQVPGQNGSAIFQMGGSSTSASVGEAIGSTGWRLSSASGNSVVIERNGQQKRVSISGGF